MLTASSVLDARLSMPQAFSHLLFTTDSGWTHSGNEDAVAQRGHGSPGPCSDSALPRPYGIRRLWFDCSLQASASTHALPLLPPSELLGKPSACLGSGSRSSTSQRGLGPRGGRGPAMGLPKWEEKKALPANTTTVPPNPLFLKTRCSLKITALIPTKL